MKNCRKCNATKPLSEFYFRKYRGTSVPQSYCKVCSKKSPEEQSRHHRTWKLKKFYKITPLIYDKMYKDQCGECHICNVFKETLAIDHNHLTGKVRGLLCIQCNAALGLFKDSDQLLRSAIRYLNHARKL